MTKITKANLPAIEVAFTTSGKSDQIVFDEDLPGFGLRLRSGSKRRVFVVQYEVDGVQRRLTIGTTNVLAPEQAR